MQKFIESFRQGYSCFEIKQDNINEQYSKDSWVIFRGDGPVDIAAKSPGANKAPTALDMVFRKGDQYYQFHWTIEKGCRLFKTVDPQGVSSRMTEIEDPELITIAVYTLIGFAERFRKSQVCKLVCDHLRTELKKVS